MKLLFSEIILVTITKTGSPLRDLGLDIIKHLRSEYLNAYLFSFWFAKRFALEKEKVILDGERLVGASHIYFQFETVIDILLLLF